MTELERGVEIWAVVQLGLLGLSHVVAPRAWVDFFVYLRQRGHAGVFATALLSLLFGSFVVAFHNVWGGIPTVLTVLGWAQVAKALVYLCFPAYGLRKLQIPSHERAWLFVIPGVLLMAIAGLLLYHLIVTAG